MGEYRGLIKRLERADGPDWELGTDVMCALVSVDDPDAKRFHGSGRDYTGSIDAAVSLVEKMLPGWWITCGLCSLTGHASIGPDRNGPDGDRLKRDFPVDRREEYDSGFHADLAPGDGRHRVCYAILHCLLRALEAAALARTSSEDAGGRDGTPDA